MNIFAIYSPCDALIERYKRDESVIFLDSNGWHVVNENGQRVVRQIGFSDGVYGQSSKISKISAEAAEWSTVWERWISNRESESIVRSRAIFTILNIISDLNFLKIEMIVFQTGVPHHYDTSLIYIAAKHLHIRQIYLYAGVIDERLIPLDMSLGLNLRKHVNLPVSDYDASDSINDFISNREQGFQPKTNVKQAGWKRSFVISFLAILYFHGKSLGYKIFSKKDNNNWGDDVTPIGLFQDFDIFLKQRRYLNLYSSNINKISDKECIKLLITAHYQPEATSYPEGGECPDHVEIALTLKSKGYKDDILYKEHSAINFYTDDVIGSTRVGLHRSKEYYNTLCKIGCIYVSDNTELSLNEGECGWYLPVTIGGTIAIERALAGLHTIITGEPWFKNMPGVINLNEISSLKVIDKDWVVPNNKLKKEAREYLKQSLSCRTILNFPGVGTGNKLFQKKYKDIFLQEFNALIQGLKDENRRTHKY